MDIYGTPKQCAIPECPTPVIGTLQIEEAIIWNVCEFHRKWLEIQVRKGFHDVHTIPSDYKKREL